jgi:hypothetical protein
MGRILLVLETVNHFATDTHLLFANWTGTKTNPPTQALLGNLLISEA